MKTKLVLFFIMTGSFLYFSSSFQGSFFFGMSTIEMKWCVGIGEYSQAQLQCAWIILGYLYFTTDLIYQRFNCHLKQIIIIYHCL